MHFDELQRRFDDTVAGVRGYAAMLDRVADELADAPDKRRLLDELGGRPCECPGRHRYAVPHGG
jgi:hypothetical protein